MLGNAEEESAVRKFCRILHCTGFSVKSVCYSNSRNKISKKYIERIIDNAREYR